MAAGAHSGFLLPAVFSVYCNTSSFAPFCRYVCIVYIIMRFSRGRQGGDLRMYSGFIGGCGKAHKKISGGTAGSRYPHKTTLKEEDYGSI